MPEDTPQLSILIVGYKSRDLIGDCLEGVFAHTQGVGFEVLYTDCSDDGSMNDVAERFPDVRRIEAPGNLGFARGNNFLATHARGDYLLLLNPDTLVHDNAIGELVECARQRTDAGAWGGVTVLESGEIDPGCQQTGPGLGYAIARLLGIKRWGIGGLRADADQPEAVNALSGAFMLVRREDWERLGGFDEQFFMYCEETDLCYRIRKAGKPVVMTPRARITHLVGSGSADNPRRLVAMTQGGVHLHRKHFGPLYATADCVVRWLHSFTRYVGGMLARPLLGAERSRRLCDRHRPIIASPGVWWHGYEAKPPTGADAGPKPRLAGKGA